MLTAADLAQIQAMIDTAPAVGEGFANPVVAGTQLVIPQINSPNYVLNVTGWAIRRDGTAQFTGIMLIGGTFTGTNFIINSLGAFFYNGPPAAGNLIASIAPAAGADDGKGNAFQAGITSYSGTSFAQLFAAAVVFHAAGNVNDPQVNGTAGAQLVSSSGTTAALPITALLSLVPAAAGGVSVVRLTNAALDLNEVAVPAAASGSGPQLFGNTSGHAAVVSDSTHGDSNTYDIERLTLVTSGGTVSLVAFTTIGGLTKQVKAGSYHFRAHLMYVGNGTGATASPLFRVRSPAFSSGSLQLVGTANGPLVSVRFDNASGFGNNLSAPALTAGDSTTRYDVVIEGHAVFTATGGLDVQASIGVAGNAQFVIAAGSTFEIEPVVAT